MIEYKQLTAQDSHLFDETLHLLNITQGEGLFQLPYLQERAATGYTIIGLKNSKVVACGIARTLSKDDYDYYLPFGLEIKDWFQKYQIGSFDTLCVDESLRGQGVGQSISRMRLDWLKQKNCNRIIGVSWVSGLPHTSDRVFEKMGFKPYKKVENFYYQSSIEHPFQCPGCKVLPCTCAAVLYFHSSL